MARWLPRRLGFLLLTVLLTSLILFVITRLLPGDPARIILGREAAAPALDALRRELGLDRPAALQYLAWLRDFATGDWGVSYGFRGQEIRPLVLAALGNSLRLAGLTLLIAVPTAVALGVAAALNEDRPIDHLVSIGSLSVVGLPEFVTGLVLIELFSFRLGWLPASSTIRPGDGLVESLPSMVLPALTATLVLLAYIARLTRASVLEELRRPYVGTAELKGIPRRRVIVAHVLRNALLPTITVVAISFGWLVSGLIVVENVFNYPGIGRLLFQAIDRRDLPLMQALSFVTVLAFALANFAADLLYAALDPRIRLE